jgi:hypothetical protein
MQIVRITARVYCRHHAPVRQTPVQIVARASDQPQCAVSDHETKQPSNNLHGQAGTRPAERAIHHPWRGIALPPGLVTALGTPSVPHSSTCC